MSTATITAPDAPEQPLGGAPGARTTLAVLPEDAQLDTKALAAALGCCTKSIRRAVMRGELPAPIRFMGRAVWLAGAVTKHLRMMQENALRQAAQHRAKLSMHSP